MHPRITSLARQVFRQPRPTSTVERFLKARKALLWLNDTNSQSFNGQALRAETEINTFGLSLHLSLKRTVAGITISLTEKESGEKVIDFHVDVTAVAQNIRFNIDNLELNIALDAVPS